MGGNAASGTGSYTPECFTTIQAQENTEDRDVFNKILEGHRAADDSCCFLCGDDKAQLTQEHVFPKWLQNRYSLWTQTIVLQNLSRIKYGTLTIPCCFTCNTKYLSGLEDTVSRAVVSGYDACVSLGDHTWFLWLGKIFYGILRKEAMLSQDRRTPDQRKIMPEERLRELADLRLFLQGIRGRHRFASRVPYSVLICNLYDPGSPLSFSFQDAIFGDAVLIRMGEVGIIAALSDDGINADSYGRYVDAVAGRKLHPVQLEELFGRVVYQISLMETSPSFFTTWSDDMGSPSVTVVVGQVQSRPWEQRGVASILQLVDEASVFVKGKGKPRFVEPNLVWTSLTDLNGAPLIGEFSDWYLAPSIINTPERNM